MPILLGLTSSTVQPCPLPLQSSHRLILLPPTSSAVHHFKSFTSSAVFLFNHHTVSFFSHQQGIFNHHTVSFFSHQQGIFNHHIVSFFSHQQAPQFIPSSHSQAPQSSSSIITPYHSSPTNKACSIITPYHSSPTNKASSIITSSHSSPTNKPSSIITPSHSSPTNKPSSIIKKVVAIAINFVIIEQQNGQCTFNTGSKQCFIYKNIEEKSEDSGISQRPQDICFQRHKCISPCLWWGEPSIKSS